MKRASTEQVASSSASTTRPVLARPALEPVRTRRRPLLVGLGVALTALGGLGAAWLATSGTGTLAVVGVRHEILAGATIQRDDLVSVQVAAGADLVTVPVDRAATVIGKRSLVRLLPGSLLNPGAVADRLVPSAGQALVGLSLGAAQRPAVPFDAGDPVQVVYTASGNDTAGQGSSATVSVVSAVVVSTQEDPDGQRTVVNVTVPADAAAKVATWGSAGRASLVLLPAGQG